MDLTRIQQIMAKSPGTLTDEEKGIMADLTSVAHKRDGDNDNDDNEELVRELKEVAVPLLKELQSIRETKDELDGEDEIELLKDLRSQAKTKTKEISDAKKESDVWKTYTEKIKEEKIVTASLRKLQKDSGGVFKIPRRPSSKTSKTSKTSKVSKPSSGVVKRKRTTAAAGDDTESKRHPKRSNNV